MVEDPNPGSDRFRLTSLEALGNGTALVTQIYALVDSSHFFTEFTRDDIKLLAAYMDVYRAQSGQTIIRESEVGDFMLLVIEGEVDIYKKNLVGVQQHITTVGPGMTLGEMSMIDGEPRFATCLAVSETTFGVLTRDNMVKIILERPSVGAKVLVKLVTLLSQRLRQTSAKLLQYLS